MPAPMTPELVAERWACSANKVRSMVKDGELRGFRIGNRYRIPIDAVEEYEQCQMNRNTASAGSTEIGSSHGGSTASAGGIAYLRRMKRGI